SKATLGQDLRCREGLAIWLVPAIPGNKQHGLLPATHARWARWDPPELRDRMRAHERNTSAYPPAIRKPEKRTNHAGCRCTREVEKTWNQSIAPHVDNATVVRVGYEAIAEEATTKEEEIGQHQRRVRCEHHRRLGLAEEANGCRTRSEPPPHAAAAKFELMH